MEFWITVAVIQSSYEAPVSSQVSLSPRKLPLGHKTNLKPKKKAPLPPNAFVPARRGTCVSGGCEEGCPPVSGPGVSVSHICAQLASGTLAKFASFLCRRVPVPRAVHSTLAARL